VLETRLILIDSYGFAGQAKPRCSAPSNGHEERLDEMAKWDLCIGSTGRAQRSRALPKVLAPMT
jgi:hypothetical protein